MISKGQTGARRVGLMCLAMLALAASVGCWRADPAEVKKQAAEAKKKEPEPPFEPLRALVEPNERSSFDPKQKENRRIANVAKPGHWTAVLVQAKANDADFAGRLSTVPQDANQRPIDLERSLFWLSTERTVALPKGQRKTLETLFFPPRPNLAAPIKGSTWIGARLDDRRGRAAIGTADFVAHMPNFQYHLVVLAREAARYRYLKVLDSVRPPTEFVGTGADDTCYYRVQFPPVSQPLALPTQPLCWTSTAYVLWDDVLPAVLVPEQRQALVDWLHWGGGLIVSGPESLDKLRGSYLDPYLPASAGKAGPLDAAKLAELHASWTLPGDDTRTLGTRAAAPWSGIELVKLPDAQFMPGTGQLVAERRVGRGRVVVTAFRLSEPELVNWKSFDSFFNGCLLRRPPRIYDANRDLFEFAGRAPNRYDAELISNVRFFTRDAREPNRARSKETELPLPSNLAAALPAGALAGPFQAEPAALDQLKALSGVAGWDDFGWISSKARETLTDAAGISVPKRAFVLKMVALYLLVVVGLNWLVFRLAGHVEWAWIAVPVVAVVWGVAVVWLAQLDIGFARSETEVAVLEAYPDYPRGHLTRYTALYSSLSTSYDVAFDDPSAVALPFSQDRQRLSGQVASNVTLSTVGEPQLSGFPVASNSTGMIHSEQMLDLGGTIGWKAAGLSATIENNTKHKLTTAAVVRRRVERGNTINESAWIGELDAGASASVQFAAHAADRPSEDAVEDNLSLRKLIDCAADPDALAPGDVRLVARVDGDLGGIRVRPASNQVRRATLVVAHLELAPPRPPRRDTGLRVRTAPPPDEDEP